MRPSVNEACWRRSASRPSLAARAAASRSVSSRASTASCSASCSCSASARSRSAASAAEACVPSTTSASRDVMRLMASNWSMTSEKESEASTISIASISPARYHCSSRSLSSWRATCRLLREIARLRRVSSTWSRTVASRPSSSSARALGAGQRRCRPRTGRRAPAPRPRAGRPARHAAAPPGPPALRPHRRPSQGRGSSLRGPRAAVRSRACGPRSAEASRAAEVRGAAPAAPGTAATPAVEPFHDLRVPSRDHARGGPSASG